MPRFGDCWKTALAELEHGCGNLDEDVQSRMALGFANCFLQKAGLRNASFNFAHDVFIFFLLASCIHALKDLEVSPFIGYDYISPAIQLLFKISDPCIELETCGKT